MHALAPYDHDISFNLIRTEYRKQPTYEQAQEVYKSVLPYATYAMVYWFSVKRRVAEKA